MRHIESANQKNINLSISQWYALSRKDVNLPMRILISGNSMYPMVRVRRDYVTILPMKRSPLRGDVVLFSDPYRERYVLHRIWRIEGDRILTWGDHCVHPDAWMNADCIWGIAVKVERGRLVLNPDSDFARRAGLVFAAVYHPLHRFYLKLRSKAAKVYHLIKGDRK